MSDSFARSIAQAAATRGQLDPFYRAISDHPTLMALRLWPVGVVAAPDLADPAHIDMRSRSIYLDTERLLGADRDLRAGQITDRGIWRTWGACAHEVFHAMETRTWAIDQIDAHATANDRPQLLQDALLLEEPRMEHQGLQRFDPATARGRFLRGALAVVAQDILIDALSEHLATTAMTDPAALRDAAGRAAVYVLGRERYGVLTATDTRLLNQAVRAVLGGTDHQALIDLLDELIWIPSGEPEQLIAIAERYRTIIGDPPPPPPTSGQGPGSPSQSTPSQNPGNDPAQNPGNDPAQSTGEGQAQSAGDEPAQSAGEGQAWSLGDALAQGIAAAQQATGPADRLTADPAAQRITRSSDPTAPAPRARGPLATTAGLPSGRMPDLGVNRPPTADERRMARQFADRIRRAMAIQQRQVTKTTPGGRFDARQHMRAVAQRARRQPVTAQPWSFTAQRTQPIHEPHICLIIDTSGSMRIHEYALGPICWVLNEGLRVVDGRMPVSLFGAGHELLTDGRAPMPLVPGIRTGGGTAHAGDALLLASDHIDRHDASRPRAVWCISDGDWSDTAAGVTRIREMRDLGIPTLHISIGRPPLAVEADAITTITDPADAMTLIADHTVELIAGQARRRGRR